MSVDIKGAKEAEQKLREFAESFDPTAKGAFQELGKEMLQVINARTPVRTGYLRSQNEIEEISEDSLRIAISTPYAGFVDFGTSKVAAPPFFGPVVDIIAKKFPQIVFERLDKKSD